jgi:hypothetical protein
MVVMVATVLHLLFLELPHIMLEEAGEVLVIIMVLVVLVVVEPHKAATELLEQLILVAGVGVAITTLVVRGVQVL